MDDPFGDLRGCLVARTDSTAAAARKLRRCAREWEQKRPDPAAIEKGLELLKRTALKLAAGPHRVRALAWTAEVARHLGHPDPAIEDLTISESAAIPEDWRRAEAIIACARVLRHRREDLAEIVTSLEKGLARRTEARLARLGAGDIRDKGSSGSKVHEQKVEAIPSPDPLPGGERITIGLVNAYKGGQGPDGAPRLKEVHLRAIGRAAPLCNAYGFNLALFNFPLAPGMTGEDLVARVAATSRVGAGGGHLAGLADEGRLVLVEPGKRLTGDDEELGRLVATTSKPGAGKATPLPELIADGVPLLILIGLGPKGLPYGILEASAHHLEVTGVGVALETATAMGALVQHLRHALVGN